MIQVTLVKVKMQEEKEYPKFMIIKPNYPNEGTIVFFLKKGEGLLVKGEGVHEGSIGEYLECWDWDVFTDYNQPITLQNE